MKMKAFMSQVKKWLSKFFEAVIASFHDQRDSYDDWWMNL